MTSTEAKVLRYFGRCPTKGCKHRRVVEQGSHPQVARVPHGFGRGEVLVLMAEAGRDWPLYEMGDRDHNTAMRAAGLVCPEHDRIVWFVGGRFTFNPERVCNGVCMSASGPSCECSCGGANHGSNHL
ncbi:hypothetical protein [Amycolatopsis sp. DSM 110486]|uniref:hypothetical protein n=1 Tax=Amycolatopsis sp. DSM 110486 TaxID=2865832 RepID=UPI001C6A75E1|nr:hypothetical protein [Amycolatopsis sp. DSM 110486]QYN17536.1 hypothetical protein K1T34_32645 [Amycolatopsis sp. DSM 110486]